MFLVFFTDFFFSMSESEKVRKLDMTRPWRKKEIDAKIVISCLQKLRKSATMKNPKMSRCQIICLFE